MLTTAFNLPVFLNGTRNYVQGTQIVTRLAEAIQTDSPMTLYSADFHKITDSLVRAAQRDPTETEIAQDHVLGRVVFKIDDQLDCFVLLSGDATAPRKTVTSDANWNESLDQRKGRLTTSFALNGLQTSEDVLVAIVQCIKLRHEALAEDVRDVWLSGIRASTIQMGTDFPVSSADLNIKEYRVLRRAGSWQSMCTVEILTKDGTLIAKAMVTFAFKTESEIHAG